MKILSAKYSEDVKGYLSHYHNAHELLYILSGKIAVNICGEEREAGAGSLLIFSRFEEHSVKPLMCRQVLRLFREEYPPLPCDTKLM